MSRQEAPWIGTARRLAGNRWIRGACVILVILMAVELFTAADRVGRDFQIPPPLDKVVHFGYYGTMAFLLAHGTGMRWLWLSLVLIPAVGALDEWHQVGIPDRDASFFDWLADELGTLVFVYAYYRIWQKWLRPAA